MDGGQARSQTPRCTRSIANNLRNRRNLRKRIALPLRRQSQFGGVGLEGGDDAGEVVVFAAANGLDEHAQAFGDFDAVCHHYGPEAPQSDAELEGALSMLERWLVRDLEGRFRSGRIRAQA